MRGLALACALACAFAAQAAPGEAYLMSGNLAKAEEHLALLGKICLIPCEEHGMLEKKVAAYRAREGR